MYMMSRIFLGQILRGESRRADTHTRFFVRYFCVPHKQADVRVRCACHFHERARFLGFIFDNAIAGDDVHESVAENALNYLAYLVRWA